MGNRLRAVALSALLFGSVMSGDELKVLVSLLSMEYVETSRNGSFLDSEKSDYDAIAGVELGYKMEFGSGHGGADVSALEMSLEYLSGDSDYDGYLQSTTTGALISTYKTTTKNTIIEPRVRWVETKRGEAYDVGVFVSLGYRDWVRDMSGDRYGSKETYRWGYGDVGLRVMVHDGDWHIGFEGAYRKAFWATMRAEFMGGLDFDLGEVWGYEMRVPLVWDVSKSMSVELSYEFDYWEIGASNVVSGYYEPDSTTNNGIIKAGLVYRW